MRLTEGVDRRENGEICVNIKPVNNVMLSMVPGLLEDFREKVQCIIERFDNPKPLDEPYERNDISNILREIDRGLDTVTQIIKNEPSGNVMFLIVPGILENSVKKLLRGIIQHLDIPRQLGEPDDRNEALKQLHEVIRFLEMEIQVVKH